MTFPERESQFSWWAKLGADIVIDYTAAPFKNEVYDVDLVLDTVGARPCAALCKW